MKDLFEDGDLGLALICDGNGACAFNTLLRYRGAAQAEFSRALGTLKALQAERAQAPAPAMPERSIEPEPRRIPGEAAPAPAAPASDPAAALRPVLPAPDAASVTPYRAPATPIEPKTRSKPGQTGDGRAVRASRRP
jgi:hypothetical protein